MTYPITESDLIRLRAQLQTLDERSYRFEHDLQNLRRDHDSHLKAVASERDRRERRRFFWFMVLTGFIWVIDFVLVVTQHQ